VLLKDVRIQDYRSVEDSGVVPIDIDVTCLVGKNESGKTAFLQALHLLNPLNPIKGKKKYDEVMDYPSRKSSAYKKTRETDPATVVTAVFALEDSELAAVREEFGPDCLTGTTVTVKAGYYGNKTFSAAIDTAAALNHLIADLEVPSAELKPIRAATTVAALKAALEAVTEPTAAVTALLTRIAGWRNESLSLHLIDAYWDRWLPVFFYFDDYSTMRGRVSLPHIKAREKAGTLEEAEKTFLALLATVDADLADFETTNFERLTRELEGAANGITDKVFEYWTQNKELRLEIRVSSADPDDEPPLDEGPIVNVRIYNPRHRVSVPFDERSRGFVWFFSFFAYFSDIEQQDGRRTILLLDEPGLALHATAQGDFLRFIDGELAETHQVLYSTHSPFLVKPDRFDRVRTVQDVDGKGTQVSADVFRTDSETVFPLQTALGYELAQTLFVGPDCLLVEGPSDMLYLQILSQACDAVGLTGLDPRWVVTPVGGADKLGTFVSLLGANQLNVAALIDSNPKDKQRIAALQANGHLKGRALIELSEITGTDEADIEDLLDPAFYIALFNASYSDDLPKPLKAGDLKSKAPRITARIEQHLRDNDLANGRLNHYRPAAHLLREQNDLVPKIDKDTLQRADTLFKRLNSLLN
jgi:predicted ATPase